MRGEAKRIMSAAAITRAFPEGPIAVRATWRDRLSLWGGGALVLAMIGLAGFLSLHSATGILSDAYTWRHGVTVAEGRVGGSCTNHLSLLPISNCHLTLDYRLHKDDAPRHAEVDADLFAGIGDDERPVIKADPAHPERASVSWIAERKPERWLVAAIISGGLGFLAIIISGGVLYQSRELRLYRALARAPHPIVVTLTDMRFLTNPNYAMLWRFEGERDGWRIVGKQRLKVLKGTHGVPINRWIYEEPLLVAGDDGSGLPRALALADERGRARLVKTNFHPLVLSADDQARIAHATQEA
jgi:hypothetical protein